MCSICKNTIQTALVCINKKRRSDTGSADGYHDQDLEHQKYAGREAHIVEADAQINAEQCMLGVVSDAAIRSFLVHGIIW